MSKLILGLEFGSTNIKAVLIDEKANVLSTSSYLWENKIINGYFSYELKDCIKGMQTCYLKLVKNYGKTIEKLDVIGISSMMHGYLAFDKDFNQLVEFRTWRNTKTEKAAKILSEKLAFNMPERWSSVFYYDAVINNEKDVNNVEHLFTLSSYIHYLLTGNNVIGIGEASGMFPVKNNDYDMDRINTFNSLLNEKNIDKNLYDLLPKVLVAGENAGYLTKEGAKLLDVSGSLKEGALFCPPEGDMPTGMVCTNSIKERRASVSLGTSANMTLVLEKDLKKYYDKIDVISTPSGKQVALIHTNNCTSEINKWVDLFYEVMNLSGKTIEKSELFTLLFKKAMESDDLVGGLVGYNFLAGEPLLDLTSGIPLILRENNGNLNLANFMQMQIYSALASILVGLDILKEENAKIDSVIGHGGFFKTKDVGQIVTSALLNVPVTTFNNASEGGSYGIALLALYCMNNKQTLEDFLDEIFKNNESTTLMANENEVNKAKNYMNNYIKYLKIEKEATRI